MMCCVLIKYLAALEPTIFFYFFLIFSFLTRKFPDKILYFKSISTISSHEGSCHLEVISPSLNCHKKSELLLFTFCFVFKSIAG